MEHRIKILINTPNINKCGGVADYFSSLKNKFSFDIKYNYIGGKSKSHFFVLNQIKDYFKFIILLFKFKPDLVHLNPSLDKKAVIRDGLYLLIASIFKKKTIVFWRGWDKNFEKLIKDKHKHLFKFIFSKANSHIVLANEFKSKLIEWGISKPIYLETTKVDDDLLKYFSIKNKKYTEINILFLTRIEKYKGIYETIETYSILKKRNENVNLIIAGDGSELKNVKQYVKINNLKDVSFLGFVKNKEKTQSFSISDIYIFPSYSEGMPASVIEAMAFGLPIITRPVGGLKDFFENGKMGYITESKDPKVFAELIEKLITDKEKMKKIGKYNHEYAKNRFLASKVAKRLENIYETMYHEK